MKGARQKSSNRIEAVLAGPCFPPPEVLPELVPAKSSVCDRAAEEDRPDAGDDAADGEDQDVETRNDERLVGCCDECLDWLVLRHGGWSCLCSEDAGYKRRFLRGEGCADSVASAICSGKGDLWDEDLL